MNEADSAVSDACEVVTSAYENLMDNNEALDMFQDFVAARKMPFLVLYLTYEVGKKCRLLNHQDLDGVFFFSILIIKDSFRGRLHITNVDLPEEIDKGNLFLMDPRVFHSVTEYAREDERKVVVFTC